MADLPTLTHLTFFSRKSEKIGRDPTFVLTLLFASKYSYLAESIAIILSIFRAVAV
jgi:hypothetical protein